MCSKPIRFFAALVLSMHTASASQQHRAIESKLTLEDSVKDLLHAAGDLSAELDVAVPVVGMQDTGAGDQREASLFDIGTVAITPAVQKSLLDNRRNMPIEIDKLQDELSKLHAQMDDQRLQAQKWEGLVKEARAQQRATAEEAQKTIKEATRYAQDSMHREASLQQQLLQVQNAAKDTLAMRSARDEAADAAKFWKARAFEAQEQLKKTLEARSKRIANKEAQIQLVKVKQQLLSTGAKVKAAEAEVREADQRSQKVKAKARAAIARAKEKYAMLTKAAVEQERTMAAEVDDVRAVAKSHIDKAHVLLKDRIATSRKQKEAASTVHHAQPKAGRQAMKPVSSSEAASIHEKALLHDKSTDSHAQHKKSLRGAAKTYHVQTSK